MNMCVGSRSGSTVAWMLAEWFFEELEGPVLSAMLFAHNHLFLFAG